MPSREPTKIWADFNSVDEDGLIPSLLEYADGKILKGEQVVAHDDEGNACLAWVEDVADNDVVSLRIEPDTVNVVDHEPATEGFLLPA